MVDGDEAADRREALDRVIGELGVEARIDHEGRFRADEQRVAVGRRLGDVFGGDLVVGARPVLDDRLLAPGFGEALRQHAAERIGDAARRRRHHDRDRLGRIGLRLGGRGGRHQATERDQTPQATSASVRLLFVPVLLSRGSLPFGELSLIFWNLPMAGSMRQSRTAWHHLGSVGSSPKAGACSRDRRRNRYRGNVHRSDRLRRPGATLRRRPRASPRRRSWCRASSIASARAASRPPRSTS